MTKTEMLEKFKRKLTGSEKDVIRIELEDGDGDVTRSKVGGKPYWPKDAEYPDMIFIAQINLEEVPETEMLPKKGMLQFFVSNESAYGLFDGADGYKVVYHENIGESEDICVRDEEYTPVIKPGIMNFRKEKEVMSWADRDFPHIPEAIEDSIYSSDDYDGSGDKILGYPHFTQDDPRENGSDYDTLLLQIDTSDFIMWGDDGVANFFINGEDLRNGDFSDVLYNWDCY